MSGEQAIRRAEIVGVFTAATELAVGAPPGALLRGTALATAFARKLGWPDDAVATTYWYSLVRYAGCHADSHGFSALVGDEVAFNRSYGVIDNGDPNELGPLVIDLVSRAHAALGPKGIEALLAAALPGLQQAAIEMIHGHCDVAQRLGQRLGLDPDVVHALGQFRERWDGKGLPNQLTGDAIDPAVRLVFLCHDVAVIDTMAGREQARTAVRRRRGRAYEPAIIDAFIADEDELLGLLDAPDAWQAMLAAEPRPIAMASAAEIADALLVMADFCDLQLPHAISHSRSVSTLASNAAAGLGLPPGDLETIRSAGLVHDLGYAAVPVRTRGGYADRMHAGGDPRLHPFYSEDLIGRVGALTGIARLVGQHHEAIDGSGFFRQIGGSALPVGARILAAAEFYQSIREGRFGQPGLDAAAAAAHLGKQVAAGRLDPDAAKAVLAAAGHRVPVKKRDLIAGLTNRELEILRHVASGLTMKDIAERLGISAKTVDNHLQNLYPKIDVRTRAGATLYAIEHGLCSLAK